MRHRLEVSARTPWISGYPLPRAWSSPPPSRALHSSDDVPPPFHGPDGARSFPAPPARRSHRDQDNSRPRPAHAPDAPWRPAQGTEHERPAILRGAEGVSREFFWDAVTGATICRSPAHTVHGSEIHPPTPPTERESFSSEVSSQGGKVTGIVGGNNLEQGTDRPHGVLGVHGNVPGRDGVGKVQVQGRGGRFPEQVDGPGMSGVGPCFRGWWPGRYRSRRWSPLSAPSSWPRETRSRSGR